MARQQQARQKQTAADLLPAQGQGTVTRARVPTIQVNPTPISPGAGQRDLQISNVLAGAADLIGTFANTKAKIDQKQLELDFKQQQAAATNKSRGDLLNIVNSSIEESNITPDDPHDFDAEKASLNLRGNVLKFMTGPGGTFITNDTLRLALQQGDEMIEALSPKTTIKLEGGVVTTVSTIGSVTEVFTTVVDEDEKFMGDFAAVERELPGVLEFIAQGKGSDAAKIKRAEGVINLMGKLRLDQLIDKVKTSREGNVLGQSVEVRRSKGRLQYWNSLRELSMAAFSEIDNPDFDPTEEGALIGLANTYARDMAQSFLSDPAITDISERFGIDLLPLVEPAANRYIDRQAAVLRSMDTLNRKKLGAEGWVAQLTVDQAKLKIEDAKWRGLLPPSLRFIGEFGQGLQWADSFENLIQERAKVKPEYDQLLKSMKLAKSRFGEMASLIRELPDDDTPETRTGVQDIMKDFFVDASNWVKGDYLDSADVVGYVTAMQLMEDHTAFQRLEPKNFDRLKKLYAKAKNIPIHISIIGKIENQVDPSEDQIEAFRRNIIRSLQDSRNR